MIRLDVLFQYTNQLEMKSTACQSVPGEMSSHNRDIMSSSREGAPGYQELA